MSAVVVTRLGQCDADAAGVGDVVRHALEGTAGAVLLDAATGATAARQPVRDDAQVADLAAGAEATAEQAVLGDDRAADPGADRQHGHVGHQTPGTEAELGPPGGVGVVVDGDVQVAEALLQLLPQGLVPPADVRRVVDDRLRGVDEARGGDADRADVVRGAQSRDHRDDVVQHGVRVRSVRGDAVLGDDLAQFRDDRSRDLGAPDVDSDGVHEDRAYRFAACSSNVRHPPLCWEQRRQRETTSPSNRSTRELP